MSEPCVSHLVLVGAVSDRVAVLAVPALRTLLPAGTLTERLRADAPGVCLHHRAHCRAPARCLATDLLPRGEMAVNCMCNVHTRHEVCNLRNLTCIHAGGDDE